MSDQTKNSVMAIKKEVSEATPLKPTSTTDGYFALQDGFSLEPSFNTIDNVELTGSLGSAKPIQGLEAPTASVSHYLRHSGVEGQEPDYGVLVEGVMGDKTVSATEYDTVAGSTTSLIKVDAGEGVNFERGMAVLCKDAANSYSVRNVLSVATDDLTPAFNLGTAPASGVDLGKAVLYKPGTEHPSMSIWGFRGNGFANELIAGAKATEMTIEATAGELINASFSMEGVQYYFNPILIDATNEDLDFNDGSVQLASMTNKMYSDPIELAAEIQNKMDAQSSDAITCVYSNVTGKFTIASDGGTFELLWATGANTATTIGGDIGFTVSADDTGATTYVSDSAVSLASYHTGVFDDADPLVAKANEVMIGDADDTSCFAASSISISCTNTKTDKLSVCADSGKSGSTMTGREVTVEITALLDQYDAEKFYKYRTNANVQFAWTAGEKTGGNWDAGKVINAFIPTATISEFALGDEDGLISLNITLKAYVSSSLDEFYINML